MATHPTTIRNDIADFVVDKLDVGSTNTTPRLIYRTSADATVSTLNFDGTAAFGDAVGGIATAATIASDTNAVGGVVTNAIATDKDNTTILEMTAGAATGIPATEPDITLSSATVPAGVTVSISSLTYQAPS